MSGAPIISGMNQLPKPPISAGMTVKKIMISPCAVTIVFHSCPEVTIVLPGCCKLGPHDDGQQPTDHPRAHREDEVEGADILVVGREQPALREAQLVVVTMSMVVPVVMTVIVAMRVVMRGC